MRIQHLPNVVAPSGGNSFESTIRQPLTRDLVQRALAPLHIAVSKFLARVVAEVELTNGTMKVLLSNVMERANQAALKDREVTLDHIGRDAAARVFASAVVH